MTTRRSFLQLLAAAPLVKNLLLDTQKAEAAVRDHPTTEALLNYIDAQPSRTSSVSTGLLDLTDEIMRFDIDKSYDTVMTSSPMFDFPVFEVRAERRFPRMEANFELRQLPEHKGLMIRDYYNRRELISIRVHLKDHKQTVFLTGDISSFSTSVTCTDDYRYQELEYSHDMTIDARDVIVQRNKFL